MFYKYKISQPSPNLFITLIFLITLLSNEFFSIYLEMKIPNFVYYNYVYRIILVIILLPYLYREIHKSNQLIILLLLFLLYFFSGSIKIDNLDDLIKSILKSIWLSFISIAILIIAMKIKNEKNLYQLIGFNLLIYGILITFFSYENEMANKNYNSLIPIVITNVYPYLGLLLLISSNKIIFLILSIGIIFLFMADYNRTAIASFFFLLLCYTKLSRLLTTKNSKIIFFYISIIYTLLFSQIEQNMEMQESFNTGRGQIWSFWIENWFSSLDKFLFGNGEISSMNLNRIADMGNVQNNIGWISQFHSAFIATIVVGGFVKLFIFLLIFHKLISNCSESKTTTALYYFTLVVMSLNSINSYFTFEIIQLIFLLSLVNFTFLEKKLS
jgi:hypothetical protein